MADLRVFGRGELEKTHLPHLFPYKTMSIPQCLTALNFVLVVDKSCLRI